MHGRYHRQMLLPDVGAEGQRRLAGSCAAIVGCGALGCASADLLARAGVGRLILIDRDVVELANLQRQMLFDERDAAEGLPKARAALRRLSSINREISVEAHVADLHPENGERLLGLKGPGQPGVILDGTDNFETRYLLNDLAVKHTIPYCYGGVVGTRGMAMTVVPGRTGCLRCLFDEPPPPGATQTCDTAGVLGPVVQIVAACQVVDALKVLLGRHDLLAAKLVDADPWIGRHRLLDASRQRPDCPCCAAGRFEYLDGSRGGGTTTLCGRFSVQVRPGRDAKVDLPALARRLALHGDFAATEYLVRGVFHVEQGAAGPFGLTVFADGRAIVHGTDRAEVARGLYARYIGV
jgi:molybdopterin/thiamine biosynthesis adenylyltransferase